MDARRGLLLLALAGCAPAPSAPSGADAAVTERLLPDWTFAIYRADLDHEITAGLDRRAIPERIEVLHDEPPQRLGYLFSLAHEGEPLAAALRRLRAFARAVPVPDGDALLYGFATSSGVSFRTHLVAREPVVHAADVLGASAVEAVPGVELTFQRDALERLVAALREGERFRIVVQGLVEPGPFELVDAMEYDFRPSLGSRQLGGDHRCYDHDAFLEVSERAGVDAPTRAASLAAALPPAKSARWCVDDPR